MRDTASVHWCQDEAQLVCHRGLYSGGAKGLHSLDDDHEGDDAAQLDSEDQLGVTDEASSDDRRF